MFQRLIHWLSTDRRLTLEDLKLTPSQLSRFKNYSRDMRQDLYDAGEMICLTEVNEDARKAVIKYRKYLMNLTLHPTKQNEISSDRTFVDDINDRRAKFFSPKV